MLPEILSIIVTITGLVAATLALLSDELKKNKRLKYVLVVVLFALSAYAMFGSLFTLSTPASPTRFSNVPVGIDSTKDWQFTGVYLRESQTLTITVVGGKWTAARIEIPEIERIKLSDDYSWPEAWTNLTKETAGEGSNTSCFEYSGIDCPIPTANIGTLIGKIGLDGEPFVIGNRRTIVTISSGQLFLRINDGINNSTVGLNDNAGVLAIQIEIIGE